MAHAERVPSHPTDDTVHGSTLHLVVFGVARQRYGLPLAAVERVLPMAEIVPLPKAPAVALGVLNLHGAVIPVLDIRRRVSLTVHEYGLTAHLLIASTARRRLALTIDEIIGVTELAEATITEPNVVLPGIGLVAGIAALSDGLLFIHDLDTFLSVDEEQRLTEALEGNTA